MSETPRRRVDLRLSVPNAHIALGLFLAARKGESDEERAARLDRMIADLRKGLDYVRATTPEGDPDAVR